MTKVNYLYDLATVNSYSHSRLIAVMLTCPPASTQRKLFEMGKEVGALIASIFNCVA